MNIKRYLYLFVSLTFATAPLYCFDFDDPSFDQFLDSEEVASYTSSSPNPQEIIDLLRGAGVINLLQEDFFLRTNLLNTRTIIDSPLFLTPVWCLPCNRLFGLYLFFNQATDKNFTVSHNTINSYLSIGAGSFTNRLEQVLENIEELLDLLNIEIGASSIIDILSMFENFNIQERQLGFMFAGETYFENCTRFQLLVPLFWIERNYFVDCEVQKLLQEVLDPILGTPSPKEQEEFQRDHLISDTLGVGDTRIEVDWLARETCNTQLRAGFLLTLPTSFAIKRGLYGNHFPRQQPRPTLDFQMLFNETISNEVKIKQAQSFGFAILDNLSAMLLTADPGNNAHLGIGPLIYLESCLGNYIKLPWAQCFRIKGRYSAEFQFPSTERLFFIEQNNEQAFTSRDFNDPDQAADNLCFLEQSLTNRLFPFALRATTGPILIVRSTTRTLYEGEKWGGFIGFDTYVKTSQKINNIRRPSHCTSQLCTHIAKSPWIWQSKVLGGISVRSERANKSIIYSLNGDRTFFNRGLGRDFTLSFNIDINF